MMLCGTAITTVVFQHSKSTLHLARQRRMSRLLLRRRRLLVLLLQQLLLLLQVRRLQLRRLPLLLRRQQLLRRRQLVLMLVLLSVVLLLLVRLELLLRRQLLLLLLVVLLLLRAQKGRLLRLLRLRLCLLLLLHCRRVRCDAGIGHCGLVVRLGHDVRDVQRPVVLVVQLARGVHLLQQGRVYITSSSAHDRCAHDAIVDWIAHSHLGADHVRCTSHKVNQVS